MHYRRLSVVDPELIDEVVEQKLHRMGVDYASILCPSYPDGMDVEAFTVMLWILAGQETASHRKRARRRICVLRDAFRLLTLETDVDLVIDGQSMRPADLEFVRCVYEELDELGPFGFTIFYPCWAASGNRQNIGMNEGYYRSLYTEAPASSAPKRPLTRIGKSGLLVHVRQFRVVPKTFSKGYNQYVQGVS